MIRFIVLRSGLQSLFTVRKFSNHSFFPSTTISTVEPIAPKTLTATSPHRRPIASIRVYIRAIPTSDMVRTTRNSQRAAAHAVPPSASRPGSPYDFNTNPIPFPSLDALNDLEDQHPNQINIFEQQDWELPATGRRRSTRQALKAIPNASAAPPVAVTTSNSNKDPSPAPFRRPPTGSKAKRHVLGDLMDPPPPEPTPSVASDEPNDKNDENAVPTAASHLVPVPYNAKHRNIEPRDVHDLFWENRWRPVHRAQRRRPTKWEDVEYYQENEWDTDDDEYTQRTPRPRRPSSKRMPKIDRDQRVLFEGVSFMRNAPSMAKKVEQLQARWQQEHQGKVWPFRRCARAGN
ncbi:hypothetical protein FA13DRAFT_892750 [Coprinellus micaceus]|uniref:Uncharacterized protein n=1 Tax=Coprinellus micaceus TaxID=71717 RepID=A0A4Y7TTN0_COPMI|nr:hypothetical protein FA13DRAFT_892750 [Coprinellus micaceus]